jgi:hypothetical protein
MNRFSLLSHPTVMTEHLRATHPGPGDAGGGTLALGHHCLSLVNIQATVRCRILSATQHQWYEIAASDATSAVFSPHRED